MENQKIRNRYMYALALLGTVVSVVCAFGKPISQLDSRFAILALITILVGSRITIKIPDARSQISVSDTLIFLAMLMVGVEAAVVLAAAEAFFSSIRFTRKANVLSFNVGVMALSTFLTAPLVYTLFPDLSLHPV